MRENLSGDVWAQGAAFWTTWAQLSGRLGRRAQDLRGKRLGRSFVDDLGAGRRTFAANDLGAALWTTWAQGAGRRTFAANDLGAAFRTTWAQGAGPSRQTTWAQLSGRLGRRAQGAGPSRRKAEGEGAGPSRQTTWAQLSGRPMTRSQVDRALGSTGAALWTWNSAAWECSGVSHYGNSPP